MTVEPERLADIHASAFAEPWDAGALADLLAQPGVFAVAEEGGFALFRHVVDEAELLTIAVQPERRRRGLGATLLTEGIARARALGAQKVFLEVAEDNAAARALYAGLGFVGAGRRRGYYPAADGSRRDALLLTLNFPPALP